MYNTIYEHIAVIGYGIISYNVLQYVNSLKGVYKYSLEYIEHEIYPMNMAKKYAKSSNISYFIIENKQELLEHFLKISAEKVLLIISASNNFLFPSEMINKQSITIINFHNALLPDFPGRNAPSWAIFENRDRTGVTWHYVNSVIDGGDIIIQKECEIGEDMKAYELASALMKLALDTFKECYEDILQMKMKALSQISVERRIYKSKEIPNNGEFKLTDDPKDIYRLLRALDYGKSQIFPNPTTQFKGNTIRIQRYKKVPSNNKQINSNCIYIPYDTNFFLRLKYEVVISS